MSRYMPARIVNRELNMQDLRRAKGLESGFYVKYPDAEKGPYILKASVVAQIRAIELETAKLETKEGDLK
jgi:hypothetical protein